MQIEALCLLWGPFAEYHSSVLCPKSPLFPTKFPEMLLQDIALVITLINELPVWINN